MPGIDRERIVGKDQDELDEWTCGICHDILDEPVDTQCCRQTYCTICINQWLVDNKSCPNDRKTLYMNGVRPVSRAFMNLLNKLRIKCENHSKGCQTILTIEEMRNHLKTCDKNCISCQKSKETILKKDKEIVKKDQELKKKNLVIKKKDQQMVKKDVEIKRLKQ